MTGPRALDAGGGNKAASRAILIWLTAGLFGVVGGLALVAALAALGIPIGTAEALQILAVTGAFATLAATVATYVLLRQDAPEMRAARASLWKFVILGLLPIGVLAIGVAVYGAVPADQFAAGIAILLAAGLIGLLLSLAVVAVFFHGLLIIDKNEALGLPRGSVRAVIALALILVFAIMSVYIYTRTVGAPADDIAKQLVTTLSVLVVAVSSFYFGSKSVEAAAAAIGPSAGAGAVTVSPTKATIIGGPGGPWAPTEVAFEVRAYPTDVKISAKVWGDDPSSIAVRGTEWVYTPAHPGKTVGIQFFQESNPSIASLVNIEVRGAADEKPLAEDEPIVDAAAAASPDMGQPFVDQQ